MLTLVEIAVAFVVIAFGAIALRFLPRDERGRRQLPRLVDESIGMYVVRGVLRRKGEAAVDPDPADYEPTPAEIAYRIGIPGAPIPTAGRRFNISRRHDAKPVTQSGAMPMSVPARPVTSQRTARPVPGGVPASALELQRRLAGAVAVVVTAIAVLGIGLALVSRGLEGNVLSATGTPAPLSSTDVSGITGQPSAVPSPSFVSTPDTTERDGSSAGSVHATATIVQRGNNTAPTPRRTPRPTLRATPPAPTPTPLGAPTASPTPTARTRPTPPPSPSVEPTPSPPPSQMPDPSPPAP